MTVPSRARSLALAAILVAGPAACRAGTAASDGDLPTATSDPAVSSTAAPGVDPECDDTVPEGNDPDAAGDGDFYGAGDVWVYAPVSSRWSDRVSPGEVAGEDVFIGKFPIDVRGTDEEPRISAALEPDGEPVVEGTADPTADGLPGPLPASVVFPRAGCWEVTVEGTEGRVVFLVDVG